MGYLVRERRLGRPRIIPLPILGRLEDKLTVREGMRARWTGKELKDCPYQPQTPAGVCWCRGWLLGDEECALDEPS